MNELLVPIYPIAGDKFNTTATSTANENNNFSIGITEVELDELFLDDQNFMNNAIVKAKVNDASL